MVHSSATFKHRMIRFPFVKHIALLWILCLMIYSMPSLSFVFKLIPAKVIGAYGTWLMWCFILGLAIDILSTVLANVIKHPFLIMPISQFQSRFGLLSRFLLTLAITAITLVPIGYHIFHVNQQTWVDVMIRTPY